MSSTSPQAIPSILLATDLSARCDRALDRAVQLAGQRGARLVVLHVQEPSALAQLTIPSWRRVNTNHQEIATRRLRKDLAGAKIDLEVVVKAGKAVESIIETAQSHGCGLIVTGIARDETLGRLILGTTVEKLVRTATIPVLVVRNKPHGAYRNALLATDFSDGSRHALAAARPWLPGVDITLFHAFNAPASSTGETHAQQVEGFRKAAQEQAQAFVTSLPGAEAGNKVEVEYGQPETLLSARAFDDDETELVIAGTHGLTGILRTSIGSVADSLLESLPCDVLVVRQPAATA